MPYHSKHQYTISLTACATHLCSHMYHTSQAQPRPSPCHLATALLQQWPDSRRMQQKSPDLWHSFSNRTHKLAPSQSTVIKLGGFSHLEIQKRAITKSPALSEVISLSVLPWHRHPRRITRQPIYIYILYSHTDTGCNNQQSAQPCFPHTGNQIMTYRWTFWLHTPPCQQTPYKDKRVINLNHFTSCSPSQRQ